MPSAVRAGTAPDEIAVVCPSVESVRVPLEAAFAALGVPVAFEGRAPLRSTALGHSLLSLLRFAWLAAERPALYAHLRSPYSGVSRRDVDWVEGKLRGRGISRGERAIEVTLELRGQGPERGLRGDANGSSEGVTQASGVLPAHPPLGDHPLRLGLDGRGDGEIEQDELNRAEERPGGAERQRLAALGQVVESQPDRAARVRERHPVERAPRPRAPALGGEQQQGCQARADHL